MFVYYYGVLLATWISSFLSFFLKRASVKCRVNTNFLLVLLAQGPLTSEVIFALEPSTVFYLNDFFFISFALQVFLLGTLGLCLAYKDLFLFLLTLELAYLGISLLFLSFAVYWFYSLHGFLYTFSIIVLAAAEAAVGLSLLIAGFRRKINLVLFSDSTFLKRKNVTVFCVLIIVSMSNSYFGWFRFFLVTIFLFICISFLLQILLRNFNDKNIQRLSIYECGFESFGDSRSKFQVSFYVIAILYLIFDIELVFLFPWAMSASVIGCGGHLTFLFFLIILFLGFVYEYLLGALTFNPTSH